MKICRSVALILMCLAACKQQDSSDEAHPAKAASAVPTRADLAVSIKKQHLGTPSLDDIDYPGDKPPTPAQVALGKQLFADTRLSAGGQTACSTCHLADKGFADGQVRSRGDKGTMLKRNSPGLTNLAWNHVFLWDGEATSLEEVSLVPLKREPVMGLAPEKAVDKLNADKALAKKFVEAFGPPGLTVQTLAGALAAYQRTLISRNTPFDRYAAGDDGALTEAARRGLGLFTGKANCAVCHDGPNFTDESFHNLGLETDDVGRSRLVEGEVFKKAFKTPGLRNVALTAPFMHDGSLATLQDVVRFYNMGGKVSPHDTSMKPLNLTEAEQSDLVAFLGSLTDSGGAGSAAPTAAANADAGEAVAEEGMVTGQFRFSSKPPKVGLVYFTEDRGLTQPLTIDQDGKQFLKQMAVASPGAGITFRNSANISHNIYANDSKLNVKFDLGLALPDSDFSKSQPVSWPDGEVLKVGCKIHPNMRVYIASLASRYHKVLEFGDVVTDFEFKAPAAKLTKVAVWLPQYERITLTLKPGEQKEIPLKHEGAQAGSLVLNRK